MRAQTGHPAVILIPVLATGLMLAFYSALVPHFSAGYKLLYGVLFAGLLPYLVYAMAAPLLSRTLGVKVGILLLVAHAWLVISERALGGADYADGMICYVPVLLAVLLSPLLFMALRRPY